MTRNVYRWHRLFPVIVVAIAGCSGNMPVPVEGVVTLNGQPLAGASVVFIPEKDPEGPNDPRTATGVTGADGGFKLSTVNDSGAVPGAYKVIVSKPKASMVPGPVAAPDDPEEVVDSEDPAYRGTARRGAPVAIETLPKIYTQRNTTTLRVEVPKEGKKDVSLELVGKM